MFAYKNINFMQKKVTFALELKMIRKRSVSFHSLLYGLLQIKSLKSFIRIDSNNRLFVIHLIIPIPLNVIEWSFIIEMSDSFSDDCVLTNCLIGYRISKVESVILLTSYLPVEKILRSLSAFNIEFACRSFRIYVGAHRHISR